MKEWRDHLTDNFCSHCGEKVNIEGKFCAGCGQSLTKVETEHQPSNLAGTVQSPPVKRSQKKWMYIGIAAIIAIVVYFFFIKSTPEKVAEEFAESLFAMDVETSLNLIASSAETDIKDEFEWMLGQIESDPEGYKDELKNLKKEGYTLDKFIVRDKVQTKGFVTLTVDMTLKNGEQETGYIELVKESGKWKIYDID